MFGPLSKLVQQSAIPCNMHEHFPRELLCDFNQLKALQQAGGRQNFLHKCENLACEVTSFGPLSWATMLHTPLELRPECTPSDVLCYDIEEISYGSCIMNLFSLKVSDFSAIQNATQTWKRKRTAEIRTNLICTVSISLTPVSVLKRQIHSYGSLPYGIIANALVMMVYYEQ